MKALKKPKETVSVSQHSKKHWMWKYILSSTSSENPTAMHNSYATVESCC